LRIGEISASAERYGRNFADSSAGAIVSGRVMPPEVTLYTGERVLPDQAIHQASRRKIARANRNARRIARSRARVACGGVGERAQRAGNY